ncbi:MAG: apolipoprotein N-acyltransferase, partial [Candidatus Binatia bacterium]
EPLRVALVQPGIGKSRPWERAGASESFARHVELTRGFETGGADLIVWPENALPFLLDANADKVVVLRELARDRGAALLVGGSRSAPAAGGGTNVYNSAFLFPSDGGEPQVYDKRILLPFVEHVPAWAAPLVSSPWQGAFAEGAIDAPALFVVRGWRVAPLVCFEAIYPGVVAARVAAGADLLVNISNDSWFDAGAGTEQHFSLAMLAAAMARRPLVRVATTGVSALVLEDGLVSWRLPVRTGAVALLDVAAPAHDSLFVRGGRSGVALLVVAVAAAAAALPLWLRRVSSRS